MKEIGNFLVGALFVTLAVCVAILTWWLLPEGRYPVFIVGIPAAPFVWLAWSFLRKTRFIELTPWQLFLIIMGTFIGVSCTISMLSKY